MEDIDVPIREELLLASIGQRARPAIPMSAWRGLSGLRYVVRVHHAHELSSSEATRVVLVGIAWDEGGNPHRRGVAHGLDFQGAESWLLRMRHSGCTEIHVHRTTADAAECRAIARDLSPSNIGARR